MKITSDNTYSDKEYKSRRSLGVRINEVLLYCYNLNKFCLISLFIDGVLREFWEVADRILETCRDSGMRDTGIVHVEFMEDPEQERIQRFYDQVASHIYQLIEQKTQHKHYIETLSLSDITSKRATAKGNITEISDISFPDSCKSP